VTPSDAFRHTAVKSLEASRHDRAEAYAVVTRGQGFDVPGRIYRTRDFGKTWEAIMSGIPEFPAANIVREDPVRKGLLYAGTGNAMYVSFDDGDHWQSFQLNLPTTSITDLTIHGGDLVASTYGRGLWILDDVAPLRELQEATAQEDVHFFSPQEAVRARWDVNQDTPLPIETPAGKNPLDGVILNYYLKSPPSGDLTLTIYDAQNNVVREYSDAVQVQDAGPANVPEYWFAPLSKLPKAAGLNRFAWDLRYSAPKTLNYSYYGNRLDYLEYTYADHAVPGETPRQQPMGPLVAPGKYSAVLRVNGKSYRREITVVPDPRVAVSQADLEQQLDLEKRIADQMAMTYDGYSQLLVLVESIGRRRDALAGKSEAKDAADALNTLAAKVFTVANGGRGAIGVGPINRELTRLMVLLGEGDARPAMPVRAAADAYCGELQKRLAEWRESNQAIASLNALLGKYNLEPLPVAATIPKNPVCGAISVAQGPDGDAAGEDEDDM
jgi:hypothetical protein